MSRFSQFGRELRETEGCTARVSIEELVQQHRRNVIVVDGSNFYGAYLYPKFDWIFGSFRDLVEEIRNFVEAFKRVGVALVFFFVEGHLDEGLDRLGTETWVERQTHFLHYTSEVIKALSQQKKTLNIVKGERQYHHTPMDAQSVVLFTLRHILHCDVRLTYAGDRCDATAYFTRNNDCLGLLSQDYIYLFYEGICCHLTFFTMNLEDMTFIQYFPNIYAREKNLEGLMYPTLLTSSCTPQLKNLFLNISKKLECENVSVARQNISVYLKGNKMQEVFGLECEEFEESENDLCEELVRNYLRFKLGFEYLSVHGPLEKWELIKLRAQELYKSGQISSKIQHILMSKTYCNNCIVEDFVELPSSSLMYQPLRSKIYSVLFHEENEHEKENIEIEEKSSSESDDSEDENLSPGACDIISKKYGVRGNAKSHKGRQIYEWCMSGKKCLRICVVPGEVDPVLHPGLLVLWNSSNANFDIQNIKWKLFASCISPRLNSQLLRSLPPTLIVPTVVLYYMYNVVPLKFTTGSWQFLQPWEVEVFMAQAVMLPKMDRAAISQINIANIESRIVKLIASFVYGCHTVRLLIEVCGSFIVSSDLSLWHFFDGKLFHSFYKKSEWRRNAANLCNREALANFHIMKDIVLSDSRGNTQRM